MFSRRQKKPVSAKVRDFVWPEIGIARSWRYIINRLARVKVSAHKLAVGFAAGAFASFTPLIGFHFLLAALVAYLLRGNLIASAVGTVVGNPLTFPFIWLASYNVGALLIGAPAVETLDLSASAASASLWHDGPVAFVTAFVDSVSPYIVPMMIGGSLLGVPVGLAFYFIVLTALKQVKTRRRLHAA